MRSDKLLKNTQSILQGKLVESDNRDTLISQMKSVVDSAYNELKPIIESYQVELPDKNSDNNVDKSNYRYIKNSMIFELLDEDYYDLPSDFKTGPKCMHNLYAIRIGGSYFEKYLPEIKDPTLRKINKICEATIKKLISLNKGQRFNDEDAIAAGEEWYIGDARSWSIIGFWLGERTVSYFFR